MVEKALKEYFDCIEPSPELIERTINITKQSKNKKLQISKKAIAVLVAAVVLALGVTGYAGIARIFGDNKGIVTEEGSESGGSLVFDFSKASRTPNNYSNKDEAMVMELEKMNHSNVLLPTELFDSSYELYNVINPFLTDNGSCIDMRNKKYDLSLHVIGGLTPEEMDGFIGTGDSRTICNVTNINGIDVCICIEGDEEIGYCPYIFYAVDDTLYWINFFAGNDYDNAVKEANSFVATLEQ